MEQPRLTNLMLLDDTTGYMDKSEVAKVVYLDFSKTFDSLTHSQIIKRQLPILLVMGDAVSQQP